MTIELPGVSRGLGEFYPEAAYQRCAVHFYRNVWSLVPSGKVKSVAAMLKAIHASADRAAAQEKARRVCGQASGDEAAGGSGADRGQPKPRPTPCFFYAEIKCAKLDGHYLELRVEVAVWNAKTAHDVSIAVEFDPAEGVQVVERDIDIAAAEAFGRTCSVETILAEGEVPNDGWHKREP